MTARATAVPFRKLSGHHLVSWPWQSQAGGIPGPLGSEIPHWDYNVSLKLVRSIVVREAEIRADCRLSSADALAIAVVWRSLGNNVRGRACSIPLGDAVDARELTLSADIPGSLLSGDVQIATQVVLAAAGKSKSALAPRYPGSILWDDTTLVALEGSGSRFPMEVVDFNTAAWAPYNAGWFLSWNSDELHQPFLRNVRLFINSSHPTVAAATQSATTAPEHILVRSAMYYDVGRQLIRGALFNEEFVENPGSFIEGSTGRAIYGMLGVFFPGSKPSALRDTMTSRPEHFDGLLQGTFRLFQSDK